VTKGRAGTVSGDCTPDEALVERYGSAHPHLNKQKLTDTLTQFGPLPITGQEQLIRCLVQAFAEHRLREHQSGGKENARNSKTFSQQRDQLNAVKAAATELLRLLGIDVKRIAPSVLWELPSNASAPNRLRALGKQSTTGITVFHWLSVSPGVSINRDRDSINAELRKGHEEVTDSILAVLRLHGQATAAARMASSRISPGHGGDRRKPTAKGHLIRNAITIYGHMRGQYPDSGNKPAFGEPMRKFVRAVGTLFGVQITDDAIKEVWQRLNSKPK